MSMPTVFQIKKSNNHQLARAIKRLAMLTKTESINVIVASKEVSSSLDFTFDYGYYIYTYC